MSGVVCIGTHLKMLETDHLKFLLYQTGQFGDALLTTPLIRSIKDTFPSSAIYVVVKNFGYEALRNNPNITGLFFIDKSTNVTFQWRILKKIRRLKIDVFFDLISTSHSALKSFFIRPKVSFFRQKRFLGSFYTHFIDESQNTLKYAVFSNLLFLQNFVDKYGSDQIHGKTLQDFSEALDFFPQEVDFEFGKNFSQKYQINPQKTVAFNVVSRRDYKIWDSKNYVAIANSLLDRGFQIFFMYGPTEKYLAEKVYKEISHHKYIENALIDYGQLTFQQLYCVLKHCCIYIGNDAGPKHLAIAAGIPTVAIFQGVQPEYWTPVFDKKHVAYIGAKTSADAIISDLKTDLLKEIR